MTCRDCGEVMTAEQISTYKGLGMVPQGNPIYPLEHEGICVGCMEIRHTEDGDSAEDLIAEFCG